MLKETLAHTTRSSETFFKQSTEAARHLQALLEDINKNSATGQTNSPSVTPRFGGGRISLTSSALAPSARSNISARTRATSSVKPTSRKKDSPSSSPASTSSGFEIAVDSSSSGSSGTSSKSEKQKGKLKEEKEEKEEKESKEDNKPEKQKGKGKSRKQEIARLLYESDEDGPTSAVSRASSLNVPTINIEKQ